MGVSNSPAHLAAKLFAASKAVQLAGTVGVERAAVAVAAAERSAFPSRLRGVGKKGANLSATYRGGKFADGAKYLVFMRGPAQLVNNDTHAHQIPRQRESASFSGVFGHAVIPGGAEGGAHGMGGVRTRVQHPGTTGKHIWEKTEAEVLPLVPAIIEGGTVAALTAIF